jgi:hypothetical protein
MPLILWNAGGKGHVPVNDEVNDILPSNDWLPHHIYFGDGCECLCNFKVTPIEYEYSSYAKDR